MVKAKFLDLKEYGLKKQPDYIDFLSITKMLFLMLKCSCASDQVVNNLEKELGAKSEG